MPFLGTQRCSYDINFPLLITLFLELFRYLVVDCHLRWDILRRFDLGPVFFSNREAVASEGGGGGLGLASQLEKFVQCQIWT